MEVSAVANWNTYDSRIFTIFKTKLKNSYGNKYPAISFSDEINNEEPSYPNVYITHIGNGERGMTLDNTNVNAIQDTMQIQVSSNASKNDAKEIAWACVDILKELKYTVSGLPLMSIRNSVFIYSLTATRVIGQGEI